MPTITAPQTRIDAYLAELRTHLRSLPHEQMLDIVEEIRSHIRDTAAADGAMTEASLDAASFSLHLGLSRSLPTPPGHEVLGWWITPLGLVVAMILVLLTTEIGLRTIRRFQRARMHFAH